MPQDDDDLPATPKCLFCAQRRDGQRYKFFGGEHMSTKTKRAFLSDVTTTTSEYRKMKPVGVYACRSCAKRAVLRGSVWIIAVAALVAVGCGVAAVVVPFAKPLPQYLLLGTAAIAGLTALAYLAMSLGANLDSETSAAMIRNRATPWLKGKGKGDTFFTQWEYDVFFTRKPADRADTAAELLEGLDDDDVKPARRRRK